MIRTPLVQALRTSGKWRTVLESSRSTTGDYMLRGQLFEFGEVDRDTIQTTISLRVDLEDLKTGQQAVSPHSYLEIRYPDSLREPSVFTRKAPNKTTRGTLLLDISGSRTHRARACGGR
jgi:hypothetical protein